MTDILLIIISVLLGSLIALGGFFGRSIISWIKDIDGKMDLFILGMERRVTRLETKQGVDYEEA